MRGDAEGFEWVLLVYRLPREPSTPRIALWRRLRALGVAQVADGVVALPADARTREQLEWAAELVIESGGTAGVWLARPASRQEQLAMAEAMAAARSEEYRALEAAVRDALALDRATAVPALRRLRRSLRQIQRRDFFPPPARDAAESAIRVLADQVTGPKVVRS